MPKHRRASGRRQARQGAGKVRSELRLRSPSLIAVTRVTFVGHATVLVETAGLRILTDPLLRGRVAHLRRIVPLPAVARLAEPHAVLISHAHLDHLDLPSLRLVAPSARVLVPRGWGGLARRAGLANVTEMEPGDRAPVEAIEVLATPAEHDGHRLPLGRSSRPLGYLIDGSSRAYFA